MVDLKRINGELEVAKETLFEYYKMMFLSKVKDEEQVKEIIWKVYIYNTLVSMDKGDIEELVETDFNETLKEDEDFLELVELKEGV